jgi:hypothetical protein
LRRPRSPEADRAAKWADDIYPGLRRVSVSVPVLPWQDGEEKTMTNTTWSYPSITELERSATAGSGRDSARERRENAEAMALCDELEDLDKEPAAGVVRARSNAGLRTPPRSRLGIVGQGNLTQI